MQVHQALPDALQAAKVLKAVEAAAHTPCSVAPASNYE